ncbi:hypothetical protein E2C01_006378 [Portunus trituberculatus]|uniref:Uncharacterized protein n=1 Tax=Portunus trituberculatus TaxID=210409 RepID=A0A5B7CW63_PORTR|nr:hypothetical protein [Portunus trituberculatus]
MAYRSGQQEATGYTPAWMMFGWKMDLDLWTWQRDAHQGKSYKVLQCKQPNPAIQGQFPSATADPSNISAFQYFAYRVSDDQHKENSWFSDEAEGNPHVSALTSTLATGNVGPILPRTISNNIQDDISALSEENKVITTTYFLLHNLLRSSTVSGSGTPAVSGRSASKQHTTKEVTPNMTDGSLVSLLHRKWNVCEKESMTN